MINSLCGKIINDVQGLPIGRLAHGAQEPRHIWKYVEVANPDISYPGTARYVSDGDSPAQRINQCFPKSILSEVIDDRSVANTTRNRIPTVVSPEPGTLALWGTGLAGFAASYSSRKAVKRQ